jgi:formate-dependent nitrite reductase membrane component NrfD
VQPGQYIEPLSGDADRRKHLLTLCAVYGVSAVALLLFCNWLSDGQLAELQRVLGDGNAKPEDIDALAADRGVFVGTVAGIIGATLLSIPFWHAPALVFWGGQGIAQALFSSTLAVWRAKGAFVVYALTWATLIALFGLVTAVLLSLLGAPQLAGVLALPGGLMFSTVFYVSLIFSFNDSFGEMTGESSGQTPTEPPPEGPLLH